MVSSSSKSVMPTDAPATMSGASIMGGPSGKPEIVDAQRSGDEVSVALVDFDSDGHHVPYLRAVVGGLEEAGVRIGVVLGPPELERTGLPNFRRLRGCERVPAATGLLRQWRALPVACEALEIAKELGCTHIEFLRTDWHVIAIAVAWYLKRSRMRLSLTVHSNRGVGGGEYEGLRLWLRRLPLKIAFRLLVRGGARVLVHHETEADDLAQFVDRASVHLAYYPVTAVADVDAEIIRRFKADLGLAPTDRLALCYGGTRYDKGPDIAVQALAHLSEKYHLLIAGREEHFSGEELRASAMALGCESRLHLMLKYLSDTEEALVLRACDAVLLPYRRLFVGQSGPLTQAAAIGKPVVVPDLRTLAGTVRKFGLGVIYEPECAEAMARAVADGTAMVVRDIDMRTFVQSHSPTALGSAMRRSYLSA